MAGGFLGEPNEAAELLAEIQSEQRDQEEEEATNVFASVKEVREFVKMQPAGEVFFLSVIMCVLAIERLANNRGTRLTLVDGFMKPHFKAYSRMLDKMDVLRKDARVMHITIWDLRNRAVTRPRFHIGVVYEMRKVHAVKFYHDILQESLQAVGTTNPGLIEDFEAAKHARLDLARVARHANDDDEEEKDDEM